MEPRNLVGVRLSEDELHLIERLAISWGLSTRSEVLRELIRRGGELPPPGKETLELPPAILANLEELVEDGWADSLHDALVRTVDRGISVLSAEYSTRGAQSREAASAAHARRAARKASERRAMGYIRGDK
jgi:hypothetical protein